MSATVKSEIKQDAFLQAALQNATVGVATASEMESRMNQVSAGTNSRMAGVSSTDDAVNAL